MKPNFTKCNGLLPAVIRHYTSGQVLMLGFMNEEAYNKTISEKLVTFYSRSKSRLWTKGEESGNYLEVQEIKLDCDSDTALISVKPRGPVCHTGAATCFAEKLQPALLFLGELNEVIRSRKDIFKEGSYTCSLFKEGIQRIAQKVGEEGVELAIAAQYDDRSRIKDEAADLIFHLLVLLQAKNIELTDVIEQLQKRT